MNFSSKLLTRSFLVGVLVLSTTYGASALTVERTNTLVDGVYVPTLIIKHNDQTFIHVMGAEGLTRSIIFNKKKALAWAEALYGTDGTYIEIDMGGADAGGLIADDDDDDDGY